MLLIKGIGGGVNRYPFTIYVNSSESVQGYQLPIPLNKLGIHHDPGYVHVYDESETELPKYVEGSIVWVKLDLVEGTQKLHLYFEPPFDYGDPYSVFDAYEQWTNLSAWSDAAIHVADRNTHESYTFGSDAIVQNGVLVLSHQFVTDLAEATLRWDQQLQSGEIIEALVEPVSGADWNIGLAVGDVDNVFYMFYSFFNNSLNIEYELGGNPKVHLAGIDPIPRQKYIFQIAFQSQVIGKVLTEQYDEVLSASATVTIPQYINIFQSSYTTSKEVSKVHWVRKRKYLSSIPVVSR